MHLRWVKRCYYTRHAAKSRHKNPPVFGCLTGCPAFLWEGSSRTAAKKEWEEKTALQGVSAPLVLCPKCYVAHLAQHCEHQLELVWWAAHHSKQFWCVLCHTEEELWSVSAGKVLNITNWTESSLEAVLLVGIVLPSLLSFFGVRLFLCNKKWLFLNQIFSFMIFVYLPWFEFVFPGYYGF